MAVSLALALGFFGDFHPALDAFAQLRLHLAVLLALVALPLLFTPLRLEAVAALVFSVAALSTTYTTLRIPGLSPVQAGFVADEGEHAVYRLLQLNLRFDNPAPEKVLSLIGRAQPDVVTLEEVSPMWKDKLDLLANAYPHRIVCSSPHGSSGVAILSRRPFAADSEPVCYTGGTLAVASVAPVMTMMRSAGRILRTVSMIVNPSMSGSCRSSSSRSGCSRRITLTAVAPSPAWPTT